MVLDPLLYQAPPATPEHTSSVELDRATPAQESRGPSLLDGLALFDAGLLYGLHLPCRLGEALVQLTDHGIQGADIISTNQHVTVVTSLRGVVADTVLLESVACQKTWAV